MIAAISMPVPVKDRQVKANTAPSGVGLADHRRHLGDHVVQARTG